jgi:phosphoglycerate kinase
MKLNSLRKSIKNINKKTVFLRADFNVSLSGSRIKEDFKIKQGLETIDFLLKNNCKIVLASHLGQPKDGFDKKYSLFPIAKYLERVLDEKITFFDYQKFSKMSEIKKEINTSGNSLFLLDNLRFYEGEERNCKRLGKSLASLADVYVNDAFAVSHRANSSVSAIRSYLPSFAGLLLEKEISSLDKILNPQKPFVVIMGGAKISTKIPIIEKLYSRASQILLGGALVNNIYLSQGFNIGKSLIDKNVKKINSKFLKSKKIILPIDVVVKTEISKKKTEIKIKEISDVSDDDYILDIGPETILLFSEYIKKAQTIVWNGPLGMFEEGSFKKGTVVVARAIAARSSGRAFGVAGGGETVEALNLSGMSQYMDWISTGGGAMLSYLAGEKMPGIN